MRRRIIQMAKPYDAEVEYIQNSQSSAESSDFRVDTGFLISPSTINRIKIECEISSLPNTEYQAISGVSRAESETQKCILWVGFTAVKNGPFYYSDGTNETNEGINFSSGKFYKFTIDGKTGIYKVEGVFTQSVEFSTQLSLNFLLFAYYGSNDENGAIFYGRANRVMRIKSFKAYLDGVLMKDYIMTRVGSAGRIYDRVTGEFVSSSGVGSLIPGPDVT